MSSSNVTQINRYTIECNPELSKLSKNGEKKESSTPSKSNTSPESADFWSLSKPFGRKIRRYHSLEKLHLLNKAAK